ncbi:MAG: hypothetical protein HS115_11735 [Spirochaetales bacterium]|nr:hypothetical protein [Spirochaetales bacterium]
MMRAAFQRGATTQVTLLVASGRTGRLQSTARVVFAPAGAIKGVWIRHRAETAQGSGGARQGYLDVFQFVRPHPDFTLPVPGNRIVRGLYAVDEEWPAADEWEILSVDLLSESGAFHVIQLGLKKIQRGGNSNG